MIAKKINIIIGVLFEGQPKKLSDALNISPSNLSKWRKDKSISSEELSKFFAYGFSLDWMFDLNNLDVSGMFNNTQAGDMLRKKIFNYKQTNFPPMSINEPQGNTGTLKQISQ